MTTSPAARPARALLAGLLLAALPLVAFAPSLAGGFLWDDDAYVTGNRLLVDTDGLWRIWFSRDAPSQYVPLVYTVLRAGHGLWGTSPLGYRLVSLLLHAANAVLLWRVLRHLGVRGAWLAAAVFGVHPVQAETVAWIAELKNTLSAFFFLLSAREWVAHLREGEAGGARPWRALAWFVPALLSKATALTLPPAMLLAAWLAEGRVRRSRLVETAPFWALGGAMGLLTLWWERMQQGTVGAEFTLGTLDRLLVAGRGFWFYLGKLLWPAGLSFSYPRWEPATAPFGGWPWLLAAIAALAACWALRGRIGRGPFAALAFFALTLAPLLGFIPLYTFRYTFVADHYQYLALAGPVALLAHGGAQLAEARPAWRRAAPPLAASILLVLAALTAGRSRAFVSEERLWTDTLARNPGSWLALFNLARLRVAAGELDDGAALAARSIALRPSTEAEHLLGFVRADQGRIDEAITHEREAIRLFPDNAFAHNGLARLLEARGDVEGALRHYGEAVRTYPRSATARTNLANLLARLGRSGEAEAQYRAALQVYPGFRPALLAYGRFLEGAGRRDEALPLYDLYAAGIPERERAAFRRSLGLAGPR